MGKKHRHQKQHAKPQQAVSNILLTLSTAHMLKDALHLMEEGFSRNTEPLPNLDLAHDTLEGLQRKLDDMLQHKGLNREIPLDYNEIYILYAAIHMYLAYLKMKREYSLIATCVILCKQFSLLVEQVDRK